MPPIDLVSISRASFGLLEVVKEPFVVYLFCVPPADKFTFSSQILAAAINFVSSISELSAPKPYDEVK